MQKNSHALFTLPRKAYIYNPLELKYRNLHKHLMSYIRKVSEESVELAKLYITSSDSCGGHYIHLIHVETHILDIKDLFKL